MLDAVAVPRSGSIILDGVGGGGGGVFFFKQKTAYEIRPRDWSSDVCSSDLYLCPLGANACRHGRSPVGWGEE